MGEVLLGIAALTFVLGTAVFGIILVCHFLIKEPKFIAIIVCILIGIFVFAGLTLIPILL